MEKFLGNDQILDILGCCNSELSDFLDDGDDDDVNMLVDTRSHSNSSDRDTSVVDAPVENKNCKKQKVHPVCKNEKYEHEHPPPKKKIILRSYAI